jgi:hypothetical protein
MANGQKEPGHAYNRSFFSLTELSLTLLVK